MEIARWIELLKQYGPLIGLFVAFIIWQSHEIHGLLDKNSAIYEAEIKRMAEVQDRLLTKFLGIQPSSSESRSIQEMTKQENISSHDKNKEG